MTIQAIETRYAGHRFRSRLEARWAVFFDALGIQWEYESQGFDTPHGGYLPDFLLQLKSGPAWFEVKPRAGIGEVDRRWNHVPDGPLYVSFGLPNQNEMEPASQPADGLLLLWGGSGLDYDPTPSQIAQWGACCVPGWADNYHAFCICPACGAVDIEFDGRGARVCGRNCVPNDDKGYTYDHPRIRDAYDAARMARFEHGESGAPRRTAVPSFPGTSGPLWNPTTRACAWCLKVARTTDLIQLTDDAWIHRVCP